MSVTGLQTSSITWTSIYPGSAGLYNGYITPANVGFASVTVTPGSGSPSYIDYKVSGPSAACSLSRSDTIRVYTTPGLSAPITPVNPAICNGGSVVLSGTVSGGNPPYTYSWSNGSSISTTTAAAVGTYTLTVSDNTTGCAPLVQSVTVTAAATPAAPTASGATICAGTATTLTATNPGGTYKWYSAASGGTLLFTGASFTTPVLNANTTYYVETTVSSCPSARTAVLVTVTPTPAAPTAAGATICAGNTTTLSATAPGGTYDWFSAATGGSSLATGTLTTPVLSSNTTYYVQSTVSGCPGPRTAVAVTVNQIPAAPTAASATICINTAATLQATAPGGSYDWFTVSSGGTAVASGTASFTTPSLATSTTYYVQTTVLGCTAAPEQQYP
jgi:hypothetical protein